jgi:hypothetical protein
MSGHDEDTDVAVCHGVYGHEARAAHGQREGNTTQFPLPSHILAERGRSNSGSPKLTMSHKILTRLLQRQDKALNVRKATSAMLWSYDGPIRSA